MHFSANISQFYLFLRRFLGGKMLLVIFDFFEKKREKERIQNKNLLINPRLSALISG